MRLTLICAWRGISHLAAAQNSVSSQIYHNSLLNRIVLDTVD